MSINRFPRLPLLPPLIAASSSPTRPFSPPPVAFALSSSPRTSYSCTPLQKPVKNGVIQFDQTVSLLVTMYKDMKKNVFLEKNSKLVLREITKKRVIGTATLDLAPFADIGTKTERLSLPLDKTRTPPMLNVILTSTWMKHLAVYVPLLRSACTREFARRDSCCTHAATARVR